MGTKMAPCYANIFMEKLETEILANSLHKPMHYHRYIDDIFFIWPHGKDALDQFQAYANRCHESIKFTFESSKTRVSFLDVLINMHSNVLSTSVYYKPTDNHTFLNFHSAHPISLKKSIVYSQCLIIKRICSDPHEFEKATSKLISYFISNDYPIQVIKHGIEKAKIISRSDLLAYKPKVSNQRIPL